MSDTETTSPEIDLAKPEKEKSVLEVSEIFRKYISSQAEVFGFRVKSHPKGMEIVKAFGENISETIKNFLVDDVMPDVHDITKEEMDRALDGFWVTRSEKAKTKRVRENG